ncbi:hypothetical protein KABACHOK_05730 [Brevundimonas phage vB_BpoS-Kabachok]|uniref:Uncharacterized protein n=2 Tax=Marchewkavirus TaxID=3425052 RepID=A0A9E7MPB7_9CAUD|nr:hypothetical protein KABACHOK_05730 [Brevundimonas phage vB_BpoS-Kabachok]USN14520.1 hypothetical protein DOMOVOI_00450 [Brevundimonas phage vB_BpoS-Domovoi]
MPDTYPALTPEASAALLNFADKYAKVEGGWKEHLTILWATGGDTQEDAGNLLRAIRNTYGPSWLMDVYAPLWRPHLPAYELARWEDGRLLPPGIEGAVLWSGEDSPPQVGATVRVAVNRIGDAEVTGYFVEEKWLGVIVRKPSGELVHVFGVDLKVPAAD